FSERRFDVDKTTNGIFWQRGACIDSGSSTVQDHAGATVRIAVHKIVHGKIEIALVYGNRAPRAAFKFARIIIIENALGALDIRGRNLSVTLDGGMIIDGEKNNANQREGRKKDKKEKQAQQKTHQYLKRSSATGMYITARCSS